MRYFILPKCHIAFNAKVGSSSLACAIVKKYYPEKLKKTLEEYEKTWARFPQIFKDNLPESFQHMFRNEKLDSIAFWHNICPLTSNPNTKVLLPFRDPIIRFASTTAYFNTDAEKIMTTLENDKMIVLEKTYINLRKNIHFKSQSSLIIPNNTIFYKFPEQLEQLCKDAELDWPLEKVNEGKFPKPNLSDDLKKRIKKYYSEDFELYESLKV